MTGSSASENFQPGVLFANRYLIKHLLGSGGMGKVYLAVDTMLVDEVVALKILHTELGVDDNLRRRFLREVQLTRQVNHPHVVRTFDVGMQDAMLYFTMEYVEGETLRNRITNHVIDPLEGVNIMLQVCDGLEAIHQAGVIHRDLKSSNIIITSAGQVKITDFGVAKPKNSELTCQDELIGSATHMAPEAWQQGEITAHADLYALGVMSYELLTGVLPFDGRSPHELMWKHLHQKPLPLCELNPEIPRWLEAVVLNLLLKEPHERPASAADVAKMLKKKLRKSTLEDARKARALGVAEEGEKPPIDSVEKKPVDLEPIWDDGDEAELGELANRDTYVPEKCSDLHPLAKLGFSAQPAILTSDDEDDTWKPVGREAKLLSSAVGQSPWIKKLRSFALVTGSCLALICIAALSLTILQHLFQPLAGKPPLLTRLAYSIFATTVAAATLCALQSLILLPASIALRMWRANLKVAMMLSGWLLVMFSVLSAWNFARLMLWSYEYTTARILLSLDAALSVSLTNLIEILTFNTQGSFHRVLAMGKIPAFVLAAKPFVRELLPYYIALAASLVALTGLIWIKVLHLSPRKLSGIAGLTFFILLVSTSLRLLVPKLLSAVDVKSLSGCSITILDFVHELTWSTCITWAGTWMVLTLLCVLAGMRRRNNA